MPTKSTPTSVLAIAVLPRGQRHSSHVCNVRWGWPLFRRERAKFLSLFRRERGKISQKFREIFEISLKIRNFAGNLPLSQGHNEISMKFRNLREILPKFQRNFRCAQVIRKISPKFRKTLEKGAKFREKMFPRKRAEISQKISRNKGQPQYLQTKTKSCRFADF